MDLALRVPGRDLLLLRAGRPGGHRRRRRALLDRRRPPLVGARASSGKFDAVPGPAQPDLVQGRPRRGLRRRQSYAFSGASYAVMRTRVRVVSVAELPGLARAAGRGHPGGPDLRADRRDAGPAGRADGRRCDRRLGRRARGGAVSSGPAIAPQRPELVTDGSRAERPRWLELATSSDHKDVGRIFIGAALSFLVLGIVALPADAPPAGGARERPDRAGHLQPPPLGGQRDAGRPVRAAARVRPLHLRGARSRSAPARWPSRASATSPLWLYMLRRRRSSTSASSTRPRRRASTPLPPLSDTVFISNNGVDVWITAVGLTRARPRAPGDQPGGDDPKLRAPGLAWRRLPAVQLLGGRLELDADRRRPGDARRR